MPPDSPLILLLGDAAAPQMQSVAQFALSVAGAVERAATVDDVRRLVVDEGRHPELLVALQTWSDQYSSADVLALLSLLPLTRIVCAYGDWCDSDGRTRDAWPLAVRVPAALAPERIRRELAVIAGRIAPGHAGPLPLTASRGEIFAADFGDVPAAAVKPARVAVVSPDRAFARQVTAALAQAGHQAVDAHSQPAPAAVVWDADPWDDRRAAELRRWRAALPQARVVAALGFPRPELEPALQSAGADGVWFKLAPGDTLERLIASSH